MALSLEKIVVWNERRIEKRRLKREFKATKDGFLYKGIKSQFRDDWEPLTRQIVVGASAFTQNFVNIGAHYGYYACLAGTNGMNVTAFEPIDANFQMLRGNISKNKIHSQCRLVHGAVGQNTFLTRIYGAFSGATLLSENTKKPKSMSQITQVFALSEFTFADAPTLFLIDTEGFEVEVIKGAGNLVENSSNNSWIIETSGENFIELAAIMEPHGYNIFHIGSEKITKINIESMNSGQHSGNFLFIKLDGKNKSRLINSF